MIEKLQSKKYRPPTPEPVEPPEGRMDIYPYLRGQEIAKFIKKTLVAGK